MGLFDFLFKGPQLSKFDADRIAFRIAMQLYEGQITQETLLLNAEDILEYQFQSTALHEYSIEPEQSRQILRLAILYYESEKECLEKHLRRAKYDEERLVGDRLMVSYGNNLRPENISYREYLTLFKD
jgi:hypothetical protein